MGKRLGTHIEVRGKKAMILITILSIVVTIFFYFITTILDAPIFFIIASVFILITYITNMISAYKDMKHLEETEGESSRVEIDTYNDFKK